VRATAVVFSQIRATAMENTNIARSGIARSGALAEGAREPGIRCAQSDERISADAATAPRPLSWVSRHFALMIWSYSPGPTLRRRFLPAERLDPLRRRELRLRLRCSQVRWYPCLSLRYRGLRLWHRFGPKSERCRNSRQAIQHCPRPDSMSSAHRSCSRMRSQLVRQWRKAI